MRLDSDAPLEPLPPLEKPSHSADALLHELPEQKVELELQNEQLCETQVTLQNSRDRYFDLYELAPVAYMTLNAFGQINEVNQTAAALLAESKEHLCHSDFVRLVDEMDQHNWIRCFGQALEQGGQVGCALLLRRGNGSQFNGNLRCSLIGQSTGRPEVLIALTDVTIQKRQLGDLRQRCDEEALARHVSPEQLRPFFQSQLIGMAITSPEKGWLQVNDTLCEILGYSSAELLRMNWAELTYPEDLNANVALFERMMSGEIDAYSLEKRFVRKDGRIVPTRLSIQCVRRADRSFDCALVLVEDISERKQLEAESLAMKALLRERNVLLQASQKELERRVAERTAELLASNELLRVEVEARKQMEVYLRQAKEFAEGILSTLPDLSFEMSLDGRYLNVWARTPDLLLTPQEILLGKTLREVLSPESAEIVLSAIREAEVAGHSFGKVIALPFPLATRWFELSVAKYQGGGSGKGSFIVLSRDITERKKAEETLARREQEFRTLAENIPDCIVRYDLQGRRTYVNPATAAWFVGKSSPRVGQTLEESHAAIASGTWLEDISSALRRVLASGEPEEIEISFWFEVLGQQRIHGVRFIPEHDAHGVFYGVLLIGRDITEHKLYERTLLARVEQGQQISDIAANLPGFVFTFRGLPEGGGCFPYISPSVHKLLGIEPGELAKDAAPLFALMAQDARSYILELMATSMLNHEIFKWTGPFITPRGYKRWVEVHGMPHQESDGCVLWYGVMLDVTDQHHLEQQLQLTRFALDRAHEAFYLIGADSRFVYVNEQACRCLGYSRDELLGLTVSDIDPDFTPEQRMVLFGKIAGEGGACFESRHRRCDGSIFPVEIRTALVEHQGEAYIVVLARDITEEKRAGESIAAREREFRSLAESLPDSIVRYDPNGVIVYINRSLELTLGKVAADIIGLRVRECYRGDSYEGFAQTLDNVLATGKDSEIEIFLPDPRVPSVVIHQVRFVAERDENGEVIGALAIGRDISALKRSERELEASRSQLRGLVARREVDLEAERRRIAREVHDELGQLLTGLQMKISRLVGKCTGKCSSMGEYMQEAMSLSEKALSVARDVASSLRPAVLDMGIVSALEWLAERFASDTGISCKVRIVEDEILINESVAIALFRITQESLTNVSRHAQADQVEITLEKNEGSYVLKICDNGVGFDAASRKLGSFGLVGIQERALMLGGAVDIDTCLGHGTEIAVRIPILGR
jgi:PAS domain S-box-containing protein